MKSRWGAGLLAAVLAGSALVPALGSMHRLEAPVKAPPFTLPDLAGKSHRLEEYRGRVLVLSLWASWCLPCAYEIPEFARARQKLAPRYPRAEFMTVNIGDGAEVARRWMEQRRLSLPVLLGDIDFIDLYEVPVLPTILMIDAGGRVVATRAGWAEGEDLIADLDQELGALPH